MAGRGDEMAAAADRGRLRASHADREQAIDLLKAAFVQGRLTESELDARVGQALASRTQAELATLTADLPAGLIAAPTRRKPARARPQLPGRKVAAGRRPDHPACSPDGGRVPQQQRARQRSLLSGHFLVPCRLDPCRDADARQVVRQAFCRAAAATARSARPGPGRRAGQRAWR